MKFTTIILKDVLSQIMPFYHPKSAFSQANLLKVEIKNNQTTFQYFNGETSIEIKRKLHDDAPDTVLYLPLYDLYQMVNKASALVISFQELQDQIIVRCGGSRMVLNREIDSFQFEFKTIESESITVFSDALISHYKTLLYYASKDQSSNVLTGINHLIENQTCIMTATDRHRLSTRGFDTESNQTNQMIVPSGFVKSICNVFPENTKLEIKATNETIHISSDKVTIQSVLLAGEYPNTKRVIPTVFKQTIKLNAQLLKSAISRMSYFLTDKKRFISMIVRPEDRQIRLFIQNERGYFKEDFMLSEGEGEAFGICIHVQYLMDVLANAPNDLITMQFNNGMSPVVFNMGHEHGVDLVLPIRSEQELSKEIDDFETQEHEISIEEYYAQRKVV